MTTAITWDLGQLDQFADRLRRLGDTDAPAALVEGLADMWVDASRRRMGYDTGQLYNRTQVTRITGTASHAEADLTADTPYAGFHNYGTRFQPPNRFWDHGLDVAEQEARRLEGKVGAQIRRTLESGGTWNPRDLF